ncbi:rare lipoprotein A [Oxalobacteraceae bacterium GrIS 1.18]
MVTVRFKSRLQLITLMMLALLLAACGSAPKNAASPVDKANARATTAETAAAAGNQPGRPAPSMPKAGSGRGAYYKDDGPGDNPPSGLELTLDAEPKVEPYSVSGNKPYVVFGKTYTPMLDDQPFSQRGTGSWYGKKFHGQRTSSGEPYDMYKMTAAHPTLPIPSYARITNLSNGKQVIVKVNDRGPFHTNRIVDLSYTAALKLDYLGKGSSELLLERLLPADIDKMAENKKNNVGSPVAAAAALAVPVATAVAPAITPIAIEKVPAPAVTTPKQDSAALDALIAKTDTPLDAVATVPAVTSTANTASGYYLQFGAFGLRSNAEATYTRLQNKLAQLPEFEIVQQGTLYRLFSGPFASRDEANNAILLAANVGVPKPIIVQR